uniref:Nitrate reductase 1, gamma subunit n=1 Tax=uncultured prokaryote TaxID=198431 RepID=H5SEM4_9ZZZZ|nr:nitrate reductase 1, gamma subunit [uncultured prokaryote]
MGDYIAFIIFPYFSLFIAISIGIYRYFNDRFSFSSLSSQFLENKQLFWGSIPWHYGIILILISHLLATLFPGLWRRFLGEQMRLFLIEITGMAIASAVAVGILILIIRRIINPRARVVTSLFDWILLFDLLLQVILGLYIASHYRWGGLWYLQTATPWLVSLLTLNPDISAVVQLPLAVKLHFINGFLVILLFPFTRLVHIFTIPIGYLWKPYQLVIWNK